MTINKRTLRGLRADKNLTQKEVAKGLGISLSTYQNYEKGKTVPTMFMAETIADYYGISVGDIFFGKQTH